MKSEKIFAFLAITFLFVILYVCQIIIERNLKEYFFANSNYVTNIHFFDDVNTSDWVNFIYKNSTLNSFISKSGVPNTLDMKYTSGSIAEQLSAQIFRMTKISIDTITSQLSLNVNHLDRRTIDDLIIPLLRSSREIYYEKKLGSLRAALNVENDLDFIKASGSIYIQEYANYKMHDSEFIKNYTTVNKGVERIQFLQTLSTPITVLLILLYFISIFLLFFATYLTKIHKKVLASNRTTNISKLRDTVH